MVMQIDPAVEVFYLDTDFLFPETYHLRDVCEAEVRLQAGRLQVAADARGAGGAARRRTLAARPRRLLRPPQGRAQHRALEGKTAWISGMRRDQAKTRADIGIVEWDDEVRPRQAEPAGGLGREAGLGLHPDQRRALQRAARPRLPEHRLHALHQAREPGDDPRSGRWQGFDKEECGIQEGTLAEVVQHDRQEGDA